MKLAPSFYRTVAVCSILSAVTTLGLIFLPELYQPTEGFEGRMRRVDDPAYELRSWVYLVHPFITFAAALGVGLRIRALRPVAAIIGIAGFALWASNEALQQTMTLFAFDKWRAAYFAADEATRAIIRTNAAMYDGLWDAFYFLLLLGFSIGNFSLGVGLARAGRGVTRLVGFFFLAADALPLRVISSGRTDLPMSDRRCSLGCIPVRRSRCLHMRVTKPTSGGGSTRRSRRFAPWTSKL